MNIKKCPKCGLLKESAIFKTCECKEVLKESIFINNHLVPSGTELVIKD